MNDIGQKTVDRLKCFSDALDAGANPPDCANCGWLLPGETVVLVGLGLYCQKCAPKERAKREALGEG